MYLRQPSWKIQLGSDTSLTDSAFSSLMHFFVIHYLKIMKMFLHTTTISKCIVVSRHVYRSVMHHILGDCQKTNAPFMLKRDCHFFLSFLFVRAQINQVCFSNSVKSKGILFQNQILNSDLKTFFLSRFMDCMTL